LRLRLKTKLVLAISAMVVALVAALSSIYISQIVQQRVNAEYQSGDFVANEILHHAQSALETDFSITPLNTSDPEAVRAAIAETLQTDAGLTTLLESILGYSPTIFDAAITDNSGRALLHTNPGQIGEIQKPRVDFDAVRRGGISRQIRMVYGKPGIYDVRVQLNRQGAPFGAIRVGISTTLLRNELKPQVDRALIFSTIAVVVSLVLAAGLSNFALRPLETISRQLDRMTSGALGPADAETPRASDEVGAVTHKIDRLGREIRDVKEVFSALKENLDQIMATLQDGLMLFTREWRTVLVSASAETFLGKPRGDMLGQNLEDIFSSDTRLGRVVLIAFHAHQPMALREVETETGRRIQVSLDFIEEHGERIGALLTMRDAESVRRIESEIELSRRLAAIGRLTSGVAHEVKNPINAIVVHLEILRQKLQQVDPDTRRHMDVIGSEIQRLDRVVQVLVDFTRPVELRLADVDLRRLVDDVVMLASPDAERHGVSIQRNVPTEPLLLKLDADLVKQAVLNVVLNGEQAMPQGGPLNITAARGPHGVELSVRDEGGGIPPEIRERIFDLYFTTKKAGSGIGLAMTFRVMQLHNGSVDFESESGAGTTFRLRFPQGEAQSDAMSEVAAQG
jgi:signal transduction histidine kinase